MIGLALLLPDMLVAAGTGTTTATTTTALLPSTAITKVSSVMTIVFAITKALGVGVVIWGVFELLIEKDQGGQKGSKQTGALKLIGGIMLILIGYFVGWVSGQAAPNNQFQKIPGGATTTASSAPAGAYTPVVASGGR